MVTRSEKIGGAYVEITADLSKLKAGLGAARASLASASASMRNVGRNMSMYVTAPMAAIGAAAVKMSSDFNESMTKMITQIGLASDEVRAMEDAVIGVSDATGQSARDMADAMFFIQSAGLRGASAMEALDQASKASAMGMGETATIADATTSILNSYGEENISAAQATSELLNSVREGKMEASDLAGVVGRVAPMAAAMGIEFHEVGAALAAMTRQSGDARESGTALRGIMTALIRPTEQAREAASEYGIDLDQVRRQIKQGGLLSGLQSIKSAVGDNEDAMANIFPRVRGLVGIFQLLGENSAETERIFSSLGNTSEKLVDESFEKMLEERPWMAFKIMVANIGNALIELGREVIPYLVPAFEWLQDAVQGLRDWFKESGDAVKKNMLQIAAAVMAVGPAILVLASAAGSLVNLFAAGGLLIVGLKALGVVLAALAPVLLSVAGYFKRMWDSNKSIGENLKTIWEESAAGIISAWKKVKNFFVTAWEIIKPVLYALIDLIGVFAEGVVTGVNRAFGGAEGKTKSFSENLQALSNVIASAINWATKWIEKLDAVAIAVQSIIQIVKTAINAFKKLSNYTPGGVIAGAIRGSAESKRIAAEQQNIKTLRGIARKNEIHFTQEMDGNVLSRKIMEAQEGEAVRVGAR